MGSILADSNVKAAIQQIAFRTEREDPNAVVDSFYDCNITSHLTNRNHQIIQGRRGTGKTHILLVLKDKLENECCHCVYFDCKTTGSAADISDTELPENHRAIQLIRDFLLFLHKDFLHYFSDVLHGEESEKKIVIRELLDHLHNECFSTGQIADKYEKSQNQKHKLSRNTSENVKFSLSSALAAGLDRVENKFREHENGAVYNISGKSYNNIVIPNVYQCLNRLAEISGKEFVVLIDEWSNLPEDIQPHFAQFLNKSILPSSRITLKVAVVKGRTQYCIKKNNSIYGFEVGADISVALDLDNVYMYDRNPRQVFSNLYKILWTHLKAKGVIKDISVESFLGTLFQDLKSAILLARASEGNPRDFILIVNYCIIEMDGIGNSGTWIDSTTVCQAASSWFNRDKESALSPKQKQLLSDISTYVVHRNNTRGFVLSESYLDDVAIQSLIDARVLHVAQTGLHFFNLSKEALAILVLDFGTYVHRLITNQDIHFLTDDFFEEEVFSKYPRSKYSDKLFQFDGQRKFQLCYFDPKLSPEICPSYASFIN